MGTPFLRLSAAQSSALPLVLPSDEQPLALPRVSSRQISAKTGEIIRACAVQEQSIGQMQRVAMLISDIEGEILAVMEGRAAGPNASHDD